jgi:hypothetical protein
MENTTNVRRLNVYKVVEMIVEALSEDARQGSRFEADGFANFFPETNDEDIREAWLEYENIRDGHNTPSEVIAKYAKFS